MPTAFGSSSWRRWRAEFCASGWPTTRTWSAECANGFEAVKAATELKPDLLMLDIQMPKLDGFDVLELVGTDVASSSSPRTTVTQCAPSRCMQLTTC